MLKRAGAAIGAAALMMLNGCGGGAALPGAKPDAPVKRQPGSWSSKVEITRLEGPGVKPEQRQQMQQMFDMIGKVSVCVTPKAAAQEDIAGNLEKQAGGDKCTFDKREVTGETLLISGVCKRGDSSVRLTAKGKNGATLQDITATVETLDASGKSLGVMEMHMTSQRTGDCKPGDLTPPDPMGDGNATG